MLPPPDLCCQAYSILSLEQDSSNSTLLHNIDVFSESTPVLNGVIAPQPWYQPGQIHKAQRLRPVVTSHAPVGHNRRCAEPPIAGPY